MRTEYVETVIIGAGQAGLATGYHLQRAGRSFVILDGESRVGDGWRHQWDTLRLFTPAWADSLPGLPNPAPRWSFPSKDEFADYLETYAATFGLPVRLASRVTSVTADGAGFVVTTGEARIECDNVVVCTGTFGRTPRVPGFADQLDPSIRQLHSSEYRRPAQLAEGTVLVVGASHSGCDIAYEAAETHPTVMVGPGHRADPGPVHLAAGEGPAAGRPVRLRPRAHAVQPDGAQGPRRVQPRRSPASGAGARPRRAGRRVGPGPGGRPSSTAGRCLTTVG